MALPSYPVSSIGTLFSLISNHAPVLGLQLWSIPRFSTVCDQAPGSTSLQSFVSDAAVFPGPLFRKDCVFDPFCPSVGGSHRLMAERAMAECRLHPGTPAGPCCCWCPETVARCQPAPEKNLRDGVAAAFQGLWKITTHIWHQASPLTTLLQHQRMWPFSGVCWAQVASQSLPNVLPAVEPLFPVWPENLPDPTLLLGIRPSHQSTARYFSSLPEEKYLEEVIDHLCKCALDQPWVSEMYPTQ
ncbi:uncharacterized protein LOC132664511 [Panthera onca]